MQEKVFDIERGMNQIIETIKFQKWGTQSLNEQFEDVKKDTVSSKEAIKKFRAVYTVYINNSNIKSELSEVK